MLGLGAQCASAFSLLGPRGQAAGTPDGYQQPVIAYQLVPDVGTPKNLGEEYRRNTPVLYYTIDANFLDYFGSNGVYAVEQAFAIMNSISNVSSYSQGLSELPLEAQEYNYQAQALQLLDVKSLLLTEIVEQMGLAEPDRWTWTLEDRVPGNACPVTAIYAVIKRNFDPVWSTLDQLQPSSYVNGTLYSYFILEFCTGPNPLAEAVEFPVDPLANAFTAVAAGFSIDLFRGGTGLDLGGFYTGLTRDDVGGLRYLMRTNNMNVESAGTNTLTFITNNAPQLLFTSNLTLFAAQALTNDAATLTALYPGLVITDTTLIFTNVVTTNVTAFFVNSPYAPLNSPATLVTNVSFSTNVAIWFQHTFANLVTVPFNTNGVVSVLTTNIGPCPPPTPLGNICTNITIQNFNVPMLMGYFYIIPTNLCDVAIVSTQLVQVVSTTNLIVVATNAPAVTNVTGQFSQSLITYFTNYIFLVRPVVCPSNSVALRQGIEKVTFVRRDFDSLLNRTFYPITNDYTLNTITNNTLFPQRARRVVTAPDILITAATLTDEDPGNPIIGIGSLARSIPRFNAANAYPGLAGPGTIEPGIVFTYNKVGPIYLNPVLFFLGQTLPYAEGNQAQVLVWGSFDGSTNAPIVYPNGTDITNLENQVLIQLSPVGPDLPVGTVGVNYTNVFNGFAATGGQPPYTWGLAGGSPALPPNLVLHPNGTITGAPAPSTAGLTFDFVIRMTDAGSRFVDRSYAITINP